MGVVRGSVVGMVQYSHSGTDLTHRHIQSYRDHEGVRRLLPAS